MPLDDTTRTVEVEIPFKRERDIVEKMIRRINRGWCKEALVRNRSVCMIGALNLADRRYAEHHHTSQASNNVLYRIAGMLPKGPWEGSVSQFNDDRETTKADVVNVLTRVLVSFS